MRIKTNVFSNPSSNQISPCGSITIEELRQCPEFSHLDDALAQNVINSIQEFCSIIADQYFHLSAETETKTTNPKLKPTHIN